ncbi:MAG: gamma-glutamyltransferase [Ferruginibacter sp.]|nr:gamma-glutamyltransferase [Ferruginibacter sp.]
MKKLLFILSIIISTNSFAQQTQKPPLHAKNWMAITGKPLAATAGAKIFEQGGNAVDAACAMLAATCTMFDVLSWGGETQALIYNPKTKKVIAINALGIAPTGATASFFKNKGYEFPPEYGPLAAVTPGTPGGLCYMLANYGTMSLAQVLKPAMELAAGYPIEAQTANSFERSKKMLKEWPYSKKVFLPHLNEKREAPEAGEVFVQQDLLNTLNKMIAAEKNALQKKKSRKEAIQAAYNEFYKGSIAKEFVRGCQEQGGLITLDDLANWKVKEEEPLSTNYKGIDVYKLQSWTQGPAMLQALNILENVDLQKMKYNSAAYINTVYQAMSLSFADRDFYYGDPAFSPQVPIKGLLSKEYAKQRVLLINPNKNELFTPGNPYLFQNERTNPLDNYLQLHNLLSDSNTKNPAQFLPKHDANGVAFNDNTYLDALWRGTTSVEAADKDGWVVSIVPSGGWNPACIAGNTGVGMSQRMQSFVLDSAINPFNVVAPGKRPRVTLTPTLALKDGKPFLSFGVQGGDTQEQNSLQFFLNIVEFGMTVQQACEAANINTNQLWLSLGGNKLNDRKPRYGNLLLQDKTPEAIRQQLIQMGYKLSFDDRTSGPLNGIYFDWKHNTLWGGSSNHGEDYGIGW